LTILLVILYLAVFFATLVGVFNGKLMSLDRGWRAVYYESSAESEKEQQEKQQQESGQDHEE
jgi:hypothetical protein